MKVPRTLSVLLWPASLLYGSIVSIRASLYAKGWLKQKRLRAPVISVGNLTVGGTGKTPMVMWLAEKLLQQGKHVAILTRGYRGSSGTSDEVELMRARLRDRVVFGVGKNRFAQGQSIETRQPVDVFLLDDGFQHLQLARDIDIVLMDASRSIGGQALLPAGPMREPVSAMSRANIIVFTRTETASEASQAIERFSNLPIFAASTTLQGFRRLGSPSESLETRFAIGDGPFFAFCGIGNPEAFSRNLEEWGIEPAGQVFFADHHRYTIGDVQRIEQAAAAAGAKALITTEKDSWNFVGVEFPNLPVFVSVIALEIAGEGGLMAIINNHLQALQAHGVA